MQTQTGKRYYTREEYLALEEAAESKSEYRNEQFENIESLKQEYFSKGNPVISMDSKKKS
ncbi:MAG: hypothetical protein HWQ41_08760 [Nostoc sp. NOS(2021)]|nr:hypothetical protein [Nostoc sp. NOS(2021)]